MISFILSPNIKFYIEHTRLVDGCYVCGYWHEYTRCLYECSCCKRGHGWHGRLKYNWLECVWLVDWPCLSMVYQEYIQSRLCQYKLKWLGLWCCSFVCMRSSHIVHYTHTQVAFGSSLGLRVFECLRGICHFFIGYWVERFLYGKFAHVQIENWTKSKLTFFLQLFQIRRLEVTERENERDFYFIHF